MQTGWLKKACGGQVGDSKEEFLNCNSCLRRGRKCIWELAFGHGNGLGQLQCLLNVQPFILFLFLLSCLVHLLVLGCQYLFQPFWLLIKPPRTWDWPQRCAWWDGSGMVEASQELVLATGSSLGREPEPWYPGDWSSIKEKIVLQVLRVSSENEALKTMFPKSAHHGTEKFIPWGAAQPPECHRAGLGLASTYILLGGTTNHFKVTSSSGSWKQTVPRATTYLGILKSTYGREIIPVNKSPPLPSPVPNVFRCKSHAFLLLSTLWMLLDITTI